GHNSSLDFDRVNCRPHRRVPCVGAGISLIQRHFLTRIERLPGEQPRGDEGLATWQAARDAEAASYRRLGAPGPDHGVSEGRALSLPHPAVVAPMVIDHVLMLEPALSLSPLQHHPDAVDPGQFALEVLIEVGFVLTDDEQQPDPGKRPGGQAVEQPESVAPADSMSFSRVVERSSLPEARRFSLALTPGARHLHAGSLARRALSRDRMAVPGDCNCTADAIRVSERSGDGVERSQGLARHRERTAGRFGKLRQYMAGV